MIQVQFDSVSRGICGWCQREKEVFSCSFADKSFIGNLCWVDLRRALRMKAGNVDAPKAPVMSNGPAVAAQK